MCEFRNYLIRYTTPKPVKTAQIIGTQFVIDWLPKKISVGPSDPPIIPTELASLISELNLYEKYSFNKDSKNTLKRVIRAHIIVSAVITIFNFFFFHVFSLQ